MSIPSYLTNTGLPHSVCAVLHVLSNANQLKALALAEDYCRYINTVDRAEVEKNWREKQAKLALTKRYAAEARRPKVAQRTPASLEELLA
jgi:hypothetical protein